MEEEGRVARHSLGKTFVRHSQIAGNSLAWLQQCHRQCNHFLLLGFMQRIRLWLLILTTTATQRTATPHCPSRMPCHASPRPAPRQWLTAEATLISLRTQSSLRRIRFVPVLCLSVSPSAAPSLHLFLSTILCLFHFFSFYLLY